MGGSKKKSGKKKGGGGGGGGGAGGSAAERSRCGEAAAAAGAHVAVHEEPQAPDRDGAWRPTHELEKRLAGEIAKKLQTKPEELDCPVDTAGVSGIPNVDLPSVVEQMQRERDKFFGFVAAGSTSYHDLVRFGMFLQNVRQRLADEHKRGTQKQLVAKALADRSRGEREWSSRSAALERANAWVTRLYDASTKLNAHVAELHSSPVFIRAMAELRARDMVKPGWDKAFSPAPREETDVDDDISFEALLALEKADGVVR